MKASVRIPSDIDADLDELSHTVEANSSQEFNFIGTRKNSYQNKLVCVRVVNNYFDEPVTITESFLIEAGYIGLDEQFHDGKPLGQPRRSFISADENDNDVYLETFIS